MSHSPIMNVNMIDGLRVKTTVRLYLIVVYTVYYILIGCYNTLNETNKTSSTVNIIQKFKMI